MDKRFGGSGDSLSQIIFNSNGFLYRETKTLDSGSVVQCIRGSSCPAEGTIVDQEISLHTLHNHSHYTDRVVTIKTRNAFNRKSSKLELIKLVKVAPSSGNKNLDSPSQNTRKNNKPRENDQMKGGQSSDVSFTNVVEEYTPECEMEVTNAVEPIESQYTSRGGTADDGANDPPLESVSTTEALCSELPGVACEKQEEKRKFTPVIENVKTERLDSPVPSREIVDAGTTSTVNPLHDHASSLKKYMPVNVNEFSMEEEEEYDEEENVEHEIQEQIEIIEDDQHSTEQHPAPVSTPAPKSWKRSKVELIEGSTKNSYLYLQEGFLYERNAVSKNHRMYMHCNQRRRHPFCHARGVLENGHIRLTREHNHLPDPIKVDKLKLKARCRKRAEEDSNADLKEIFQEESANFKDSSFEFKYNFFGRMMKRRKRTVPDVPNSMEEFMQTLQENELRLCTSQTGQQFFSSFITAADFSIATFISPAFNHLLKNVETVYIDCMFKEVPFLFSHLCTVLVSIEDYLFPMAYALMTSDTEASYAILFKYFKQQLPELTPKKFVLEYDTKVSNSVGAAYPDSECTGGLLNYSLGVWREVQDNNLITSYTKDREIQLCLRMILALPLLPSSNVEEGFAVVQHRIQNLKEGRLMIQEILGFVHDVWLNCLGADSFSVAGKADRCCLDIDAYLGRLKYKVGNSSGNIWITLDKLKQFEDSERKEMEKVLKRAPGKRKTSCILSNGKLKEVTEKLINMKITTKDFLEEVLALVNPPTSDALEMYTKVYPVRIAPQFSPVVHIVTFN